MSRIDELIYHKFYIGDIVSEHMWICATPGSPMYGIVVLVERDFYRHEEWLEIEDDRITIMWFENAATESLPSCFVNLVSTMNPGENNGEEETKTT